MKKLFIILFLLAQGAGATVWNRTTNVGFSTLQAAFDALPSPFTQDILLEIDNDTLLCVSATLVSKIMLPYRLTLRGVAGKTPVLNANGNNTAIEVQGGNTLVGNITFENLEIWNYNLTPSQAAGIKWQTVKGDNFLTKMIFRQGSVPMRFTTNCGNITLTDCESYGHTYGAFRFGLGNSDYLDLGIITFRRVKIRGATTGIASTDDCLVLKSSPHVLIEDCDFEGAGRTLIACESVAKTDIRRNILANSGLQTNSAAAIQISNITTSYSRNVRIENNLVLNSRNGFVYGASVDTLYINNNTIVEASSCNANAVSLVNGKNWFQHYNNLYVRSPSNVKAILSVSTYTAADASLFLSNHNFYVNKNVSSGVFSGTFGSTNLGSFTLASFQSKGKDLNGSTAVPTFNQSINPLRPFYMLDAASPGRNAGTQAGYIVHTTDLLRNTVTGIPDVGAYSYDDALKPCPTAFILSSTHVPSDDINGGVVLKQANESIGSISASNRISGAAKVTYEARSILLNTGFSAESGTVFKAQIGGCR
jgi:Right handed beta helix region